MIRQFKLIKAALFMGAVLLAACAAAADFSADTVTQFGSASITGKIYRRGSMIRQDTIMGPNKSTIIIRPDKKVVWIINPALKRYSEMPYNPKVADVSVLANEKELSKFAVKKKLGSEKVNGYDCEKFELTFKDKQANKSTIWLAKKLQFPIKTQSQTPNGVVTSQCKNIKASTPDKKLFELPTGYKKVSPRELGGAQPVPAPKPGPKPPAPRPKK
ncbi:MAG: DUF4412 domain-containing protein [Armatimonadota bacterium]|nr:DUF4412 domain-containing protein [Armatimonadota bacterium]